jgi:hypothetical protein
VTLRSGHRYHNTRNRGWLDIERSERSCLVIDHNGDRFVSTQLAIDGLDVDSGELLTDAHDYPARSGDGWQLGRMRLNLGCRRMDMLSRYPERGTVSAPKPGQLALF